MIDQFKEKLNLKGEVYLRVKVRPKTGLNKITQILKDQDGEIIKIDIAVPAVKNKANQELIKFLAEEFSIDKAGIKILSGAHERLKLIKMIK
jgi:uncharacterized protein